MSHELRQGVAYTGGAFLIWGLTPMYWKLLKQVPPLELLAHRIVWALVLVALWMTFRGRWPALRATFRRPTTVLTLAASTCLIAFNWGLFIYAVNTDHVLSTSLGYFINPLVNVLLGLVVLRERLNRRRWVAVALAGIAVSILAVRVGHVPWLSLGLAVSFAFYGLLRKTVAADAVVGLTFETAALTPVAGGLLVWLASRGVGAFGHSGAAIDVLLIVAGAVTAIPLIMFTLGARRLPLSTVGLLQYIAPTCTFLLAVFHYGEPFTAIHGLTFGLIWIALAIYTSDLRARLRRVETPVQSPPPAT